MPEDHPIKDHPWFKGRKPLAAVGVLLLVLGVGGVAVVSLVALERAFGGGHQNCQAAYITLEGSRRVHADAFSAELEARGSYRTAQARLRAATSADQSDYEITAATRERWVAETAWQQARSRLERAALVRQTLYEDAVLFCSKKGHRIDR